MDIELENGICEKCGGITNKKHLGRSVVEYCLNCFDWPKFTESDKCCFSPSPELRKRIISNGVKTARYQCTNCGASIGGAIKYKNTEIDIDSLPLFDFETSESFQHDCDQSRFEFNEEFNKLKQQFRFNQMDEYYQSPKWQQKRLLVFLRDKKQCQSCLTATATQVHHLTYDHFGNEPLFDLVSICDPCHEKVTQMSRGQKSSEILH